MLNSTPDISLKAAIMVLFDGGARAEELLNVRLKDLTKKNVRMITIVTRTATGSGLKN